MTCLKLFLLSCPWLLNTIDPSRFIRPHTFELPPPAALQNTYHIRSSASPAAQFAFATAGPQSTLQTLPLLQLRCHNRLLGTGSVVQQLPRTLRQAQPQNQAQMLIPIYNHLDPGSWIRSYRQSVTSCGVHGHHCYTRQLRSTSGATAWCSTCTASATSQLMYFSRKSECCTWVRLTS